MTEHDEVTGLPTLTVLRTIAKIDEKKYAQFRPISKELSEDEVALAIAKKISEDDIKALFPGQLISIVSHEVATQVLFPPSDDEEEGGEDG